MPGWMKDLESSMREGGVRQPFALMNSAGIKRGSKTVVSGESEAKARLGSFARATAAAKKRHGVRKAFKRY